MNEGRRIVASAKAARTERFALALCCGHRPTAPSRSAPIAETWTKAPLRLPQRRPWRHGRRRSRLHGLRLIVRTRRRGSPRHPMPCTARATRIGVADVTCDELRLAEAAERLQEPGPSAGSRCDDTDAGAASSSALRDIAAEEPAAAQHRDQLSVEFLHIVRL
jgi:hypothetical protein